MAHAASFGAPIGHRTGCSAEALGAEQLLLPMRNSHFHLISSVFNAATADFMYCEFRSVFCAVFIHSIRAVRQQHYSCADLVAAAAFQARRILPGPFSSSLSCTLCSFLVFSSPLGSLLSSLPLPTSALAHALLYHAELLSLHARIASSLMLTVLAVMCCEAAFSQVHVLTWTGH